MHLPLMELLWVAFFGLALVLFGALMFAKAWDRPVLERRARISGFLLFAFFAWAQAADIVLGARHSGAAARHDAIRSGILLFVAGIPMVGLAIAVARGRTRPPTQ